MPGSPASPSPMLKCRFPLAIPLVLTLASGCDGIWQWLLLPHNWIPSLAWPDGYT